MDGGRVLRGLLALKLDFVKATSIAVTIGQGLAMMMIFFGILGNLWLAIIGFFLYVGAGGENRAVMMRSVLGRVPTSEAMVTDFRSLRPEMPLADAIAGIQRGCQEDFPVIGDDGLEGVLTQAAIVAAIREKGQTAMVSDAMERDVLIVAGTETLDKVFRRIVVERKPAAAVVEGGRLKGMLCPDGLNRFLGIRLALKGLSAD